MQTMRRAFVALVLMFLAGGAFAQGLGRVNIGAAAPDFQAPGADGKRHSLAANRGRVVVLEWMSPACPYTEARYTDKTMQALQKQARSMGAVWYSVNTSRKGKPGYLTAAKARSKAKAESATPTATLLDDGGKLGRLYGARTTPSFFIIGKEGKLLYQGAIDDDVFAEGKATRNHVREALTDIAAGKAVRVTETRPYGCAVEY